MNALFLLVLSLGLAAPAWVAARDFSDPFATESSILLRPSAVLSSRVGHLPCADSLPLRPISAVDVLDLAICNNPQTREVWANARAQAAQLGLAQSAWLPSLNGKLAQTRVKSEAQYETQKSAALTLSWLAFDFGARDAALSNARYLMLAASSTQLASIQSLFLSSLQAYYTAQSTQ